MAAQLRAAGDILLELARLPPRGLVFDIGSLKSPLHTHETDWDRVAPRIYLQSPAATKPAQ